MTIVDQTKIGERAASVSTSRKLTEPSLSSKNTQQSGFQSMLIRTIENSQSSIAQQSRTRNSEARYSTAAQPKISAQASEASRVSAAKVAATRESQGANLTEAAVHHRAKVEQVADHNLNALGRQYFSQRLETQDHIVNYAPRIDAMQSSQSPSALSVVETLDEQTHKNSFSSDSAKSAAIQFQEDRLQKDAIAQGKSQHSEATSIQDDLAGSEGTTVSASEPSTNKILSISSEHPRDTPKPAVNVLIQSYVGTEQWGREVRQKVVWMFGIGQQSATLTLNPPNLGPLHVSIKMQNNIAHTTFSTNDPSVRQALTDGLEQLGEMLSKRGLVLGTTCCNSLVNDNV
jgi:flagellar hook-length control protein FliK